MKFTKAIIIIILFIFFYNHSKSQTLYFIKGGINISNVRISNLPSELKSSLDTRPILQFNVGAYAQSQLNRYFSIKYEVKYSGKGYRFKNDYTAKLHYLNASALVNYKPIQKLSFDCGPEIGGLVYSLLKTSDGKQNAKDIFDGKFDFSAVAGLNYEITPKIIVSARYIWGLTKIMSITHTKAAGNELKYLNKIIEIGVNYNFKKSKKQVIL